MAAHKYWRFRATKLDTGNQFGFLEFMFYDASDNPLSVGGTPIASSSYGSSSPNNAFDGSVGTDWQNDNSFFPAWIGYNHAAPVEPTYIIATIKRGTYQAQPYTGSTWIDYSDDGSLWTTVGRIYLTSGDISNSGSGPTTFKWLMTGNATSIDYDVSRLKGDVLNQGDNRSNLLDRRPVFLYSPYKGYGTISGVVTINDVPGSRRVRLFIRTTGQLVDEVWSEADGNYTFTNVVPGIEYFVVGHDHTRSYNAVVQDMVMVAV